MDHLELNKIIEAITKPYQDEIVALKSNLDASRKREQQPFRSEKLDQLATALAKAQSEYKVAELNKQNPYFKSKYADLLAVIHASRPALSKYGLSVVQNVLYMEDGTSWLYTILLHNSDQYIESRARILPAKSDIQTVSSYVTYLKRLTYTSLTGVVVGDELDDDGEAAVAESRELFAKGTALNTNYNPRETSPETISKDQLADYEYELQDFPDIAEMILTGLKIQSLADIPRSKHKAAITRIREIKTVRNSGGTKR